MIESWGTGLLVFFRTVSQILTAGVAITALSLLLYALTFNLRDRVARSFALILSCVVIVFTAEAIGGVADDPNVIDFWLRAEWAGIIFLPPTYLHFSDALLATTGKPSRGRRKLMTRISYIISLIFFIGLPFPVLFETIIQNHQPGAYLLPRHNLSIFALYYLIVMILTWYNFARSFLRTTTPTSRRRMGYLVIGALAPAFGSFPYMIFGSGFAERHPLFFWVLAASSNILVLGLIVLMAYAVAFFGVPWSDRMVKNRLFKWLIRGPATASITLAVATIVRRIGDIYGDTYSAFVPITMVATILICQYVITLFSPLWEKWLFFGKDRENLELLHMVEDGILTVDDVRQYIELILAAVCDRLQVPGAYAAVLEAGKLELVVTIGKNRFEDIESQDELQGLVLEKDEFPELFRWGDDCLVALENGDGDKELLGLLGISNLSAQELDKDQINALDLFAGRICLALRDRRAQQKAFQSLQTIKTDVAFIRQVRAAGQYNEHNLLMSEDPFITDNVAQWVRDALSHYWGGPRLSESPLMRLQIVKDSLEEHEGSTTRALRAVLRQAIEKIRPEGERRFTGEWILYNILELKFLEGKKVREIAMRLAMSEADLYRKQRIAIESVGNTIIEMEAQTRNQDNEKLVL
jgi:hypothetical protein